MENTGDAFIARFSDKISSEKIAGVNAIIQIEITGEKQDVWHIVLDHGNKRVVNAPAEAPTLTFSCDAEDFAKLLDGQLDIMRSFMTGKLRLSGDISAAMKLATLLS